jgi:hypothetical protein
MRPIFCPRQSPAVLLASVLASACGGPLVSSTITYYPPRGEPAEDMCVAQVQRIEHIDERTELGFSAIDVLGRVAGMSSSPLVWLEPPYNDEYSLAYGPERGTSSLNVRVAAADGAVLYHYRVPRLDAPAGTQCDPGSLEIPIEVTLQSGGRALDETFVTALEASEPFRGHFVKTFEPGALAGGLVFEKLSSLDPQRSFWLGPLTLEATLWEGGSQGSLRGSIGSDYAKPSKQPRPLAAPALEPGALALWPSAEQCESSWQALPSEAKLIGFSAREVVDVLRAASEQELDWADGSSTQLRLEFMELEPQICQAVDDGVQFDAAVHASTSDGRIDTRFPVRIAASGDGGQIGEISISRQGSEEPLDAAELEAMGSREDDLAGYGSVLIELEARYRGARASGSIAVRGFDEPNRGGSGAYASTLIQSGTWAR